MEETQCKNTHKIDTETPLSSISSSASQVKLYMRRIINIFFSWSIYGLIMRLAAINMSDIIGPKEVVEDSSSEVSYVYC